MNDLELVMTALGVDEDAAYRILELCDVLNREDEVARYGYAKDTPRGRELAARLDEPDYRARLHDLAESEGLPESVVSAI